MPDASSLSAWARRMTALFLWTVALVLFLWFFSAFATVGLGVLTAVIVTCALSPLLRLIPAPRGVAAGLLGLGFIAVAGSLVLALSLPLALPVKRQLEGWPQSRLVVDDLLKNWSARLALHDPLTSEDLLVRIGNFFAGDRGSLLLSRGADIALAILLWLAFVFIGSIFLLASPPDRLLRPMLRVFAPDVRPDVEEMLASLGSKLRWWMIGTVAGMLVVFGASCLGYFASGLKFALPLALLAGLAEIVPTVGPATAALIALLFAAGQGSGAVVGVLVTYAIIQSLEAYVVLPLIMRGVVKIHPAVTLFSVVLWAKIFGVPGMMLAIPINLTIGSAVEYLYIKRRDRQLKEAATASVREIPESLTI